MYITVPLFYGDKLVVSACVDQVNFSINNDKGLEKAGFVLDKERCVKFAKMLLVISEEVK